MTKYRTIDFRDPIKGGALITFLRAEVRKGTRSPFAYVRYSVQGEEQSGGLRLDLDKRVFLDHFDDEKMEEAARNAAPKVAGVVSKAQARVGSKVHPVVRASVGRLGAGAD
ncbi:MAG TPA: hypothetical protein VEU62_23310 [Bryobacterales bacterium]|nr:hypothetical protein [Bryobacterales bacterium]